MLRFVGTSTFLMFNFALKIIHFFKFSSGSLKTFRFVEIKFNYVDFHTLRIVLMIQIVFPRRIKTFHNIILRTFYFVEIKTGCPNFILQVFYFIQCFGATLTLLQFFGASVEKYFVDFKISSKIFMQELFQKYCPK